MFGGGVMRFASVALLAVAAISSGCATAVRGTTEQVLFESDPVGAKVQTSNGLTCVTPCALEIERSATFTATFTLGEQTKDVFVDTEVPDQVAATMAANILLTPIILIPVAIAADAASGANLNHTPNPVRVTFDPVVAREEDAAGPSAPADDGAKPADRTFKLETGQGEEKVATIAPTPESPPAADEAVWVKITVDFRPSTFSNCTPIGGQKVFRLPLDKIETWVPVTLRRDPGMNLSARASGPGEPAAIHVRALTNGRTEKDVVRVPLATLEPGTGGVIYTQMRTVSPFENCGDFLLYVDIVDGQGNV